MANFRADVYNWWSAQSFLKGKQSRKIAHNTYVVDLGFSLNTFKPMYGVKYYDTIVVSYYFGDMYKLNSGGWKTKTTKERIEKSLPSECALWQDKGIWYLGIRESSREPGRVWVYEDNMILHNSPSKGWEVEGANLYETEHWVS